MAKTVEYYISKGFDKKMAEYFSSGRKKVVSVKANADFSLTLEFDNGEKRLYDVRPLIQKGTVFEKIACFDVFKGVYVDDCNSISWDINPKIDSNTVWENKIDISPDTCYVDSVPVDC